MKDTRAFIYSSRFGDYTYGEAHPFKLLRYRLTFELINELGLLSNPATRVLEAAQAEEADLARFHRRDYLAVLREFSAAETPRANFLFGLGDLENPVFPGVYDWARLVCGGTLDAARLVADGGCRIAFHMAGGWHHAQASRASGFSYLNDAVIAIHALLERGLRVAYVDLDAHHGDGVQEAFYDNDQVLTISLHETGDDFFPHTGYVDELGCGCGYGYSVNVPLSRHCDDRLFLRAFNHIVPPLLSKFAPDVLLTQMGVDGLRTDPLTRLELTTAAYESCARWFRDSHLPWVVLGGGGYHKINVARTWTLLWGIIQGVELPDFLPKVFCGTISALGFPDYRLRDLPHQAQSDDFSRAEQALDANLEYLDRHLFPLHGIGP
ncbi:acetoin utilization protein AcuC [Geoalkalibacter ferrihydriticus]|uniref:Acetoin utilization protein AcuC n=2 Tax=Geoalkalibacter ferrihydriticus TaxID=392333 RepID=A0A0C2HLF2_9BACT|nr:acetoin utilization protein AcuC [Geoalkalibacter ferrihydriticus]KIH75825.1 histone deacetylase [Geoalkalibacter ferrihydriticus DSM 17813]SDM66764.1 acetoin utilization protein AcuC [Geoalkalibacter ferrihydriticus]